MPRPIVPFRSHGSGLARPEQFSRLGATTVIESTVLVFHPENISIGDGCYVGHQTLLHGHHQGSLRIGDHCWIGPQCFLHGAGGIEIGESVGLGPGVRILTSEHEDEGPSVPTLWSPVRHRPVVIEEGAHVGMGALLLPGVRLGRGCKVGAGAVVTEDVAPATVVAGVPARLLRHR